MDINEIDFDKLRRDLEDYFGSAIYSNPFAMADVINVDCVNNYKLIQIAIENGFDLEYYKIDRSR